MCRAAAQRARRGPTSLAFARGVIGASVGRRVLVGLESDGVRSAGWLDWQLGSPRAASEVWSVLKHPDEADMAAAEGLFGELGATALAMPPPGRRLAGVLAPSRLGDRSARRHARWSKAEWSEASRAVSAASGAPIRFATFGRSDDPGYVAECARAEHRRALRAEDRLGRRGADARDGASRERDVA